MEQFDLLSTFACEVHNGTYCAPSLMCAGHARPPLAPPFPGRPWQVLRCPPQVHFFPIAISLSGFINII